MGRSHYVKISTGWSNNKNLTSREDMVHFLAHHPLTSQMLAIAFVRSYHLPEPTFSTCQLVHILIAQLGKLWGAKLKRAKVKLALNGQSLAHIKTRVQISKPIKLPSIVRNVTVT